MTMKLRITLFSLFCFCVTTVLRAERVDMIKAGAATDGKSLNTRLINSTIDRLNANGGGTLYFPAGKYLTGSIRMKSNITLELEAGATLLFSDNFDDYLPFVEMRYEGVMMKSFQPLIYAVDAENITIKGEGTLDGQGKKWWMEFFRVMIDLRDNGVRDINKYQPMWDKENDTKAIYADTNEDYVGTLQRRFFRPPFIQTVRCKGVKIEGVKIINSPFWTVNPEFCENVVVKGITIHNVPSPNTDGINPESCRNVHISDCHISVGDDCITIKSGRDAQGRRLGVPCENITITNCIMLAGHGGVVIGSEMSGGVRKVAISNCIFDGTDRGIRLKSTRGRGGVVEDIRVSNIVMSNIKQEAVILDLKYSKMPLEPKSERTPIFRNVHISGMTVTDVKTPIKIAGLEEAPISDIVLRDIHIRGAGQKCVFEDCERITLDDVTVNGEEVKPAEAQTQTYETAFARPLNEVLADIQQRFGIRLKYDIDTVGKVLPYADFRIRPYSVEESLTNVLSPFDYKFVKQGADMYKLKAYEYPRRTDADGEKMLAYLNSLYADKEALELRADSLRKEVRRRLGIDALLSQCVKSKPVLSKVRKFDGYTVQNFALETLPGLYVCGSVYVPKSKGKHALIICPNGHFGGGRYREDQQQRMGTLARMGAVCVDYDLFGWGESALQVGSAAHRSSAAHTIQAMNGLLILDYMLASRKDIDVNRIGVNGGSGGGTQTVLLSVLDGRFTASAPVVSLASHFDGGCPCESGMPIQLAAGGTCNAELAAIFAPRPQLVVSDGGDWTASVPTLEFPYLQRVYGFYGAKDKVVNVHLPKEKHDFGPNKRNAVYDFFAEVFDLDKKMLDESKITIEPESAMYSFGEKGGLLPESAVRSFDGIAAYFDKKAFARLKSDASLEKKANEWVASLNLDDDKKAGFAATAVYNHLRKVRDWHNEHPYTTIPAGINPLTGKPLSKLDREMIADSAMPEEVHEKLMKDLRRVLTEEQVEQILDKYTVGKVAFTLKGYQAIVPNMTEEETAFVLEQLKLAREQAIDYKNMKQISAIFEIYKTKCEQYFNEHGRNWRQMFKDYVNKRKAEK